MTTVKDDAIQGAYQNAISLAIRHEADHLGKLFGRDLNRKDTFETVGNDAQVTYEQKPAYIAPKAAAQPTQPTAPTQQPTTPTQQPTGPKLNFTLL